ncbi:MAG: hypothetical protein N4J56_007043 [Chroococcidiopsis sp. SAG 2025]|uniref:hypothetical protein n=1 Tax=Chroococcidiopsis sp. SAG 2025 TaxID=171389 RepID=UPI00293727DB|nr:hypothetical protein [Chroococcidiopsis sp. SAG 2025]MDV2997338.1 hypothetical protein [Chroococcidiopsis sp. SAG 2025]
MKRKMTTIIAGTMLAITNTPVIASATVVNTTGEYLTNAKNPSQQVVVQRLTPHPQGIIVAEDRRRRSRTGRR